MTFNATHLNYFQTKKCIKNDPVYCLGPWWIVRRGKNLPTNFIGFWSHMSWINSPRMKSSWPKSWPLLLRKSCTINISQIKTTEFCLYIMQVLTVYSLFAYEWEKFRLLFLIFLELNCNIPFSKKFLGDKLCNSVLFF